MLRNLYDGNLLKVINNFQHYPSTLIAYKKYPFIKGGWVFETFEERGGDSDFPHKYGGVGKIGGVAFFKKKEGGITYFHNS